MLGIFFNCVYFITKKQRRYNSILKIRKWGICFAICILISYTFTNVKDREYEDNINVMKNAVLYENDVNKDSAEYVGIIISNPTPKEYYTKYLLKLTKVNNKDVNITVYLKLKGVHKVGYGDEISFVGEYEEPDSARNDKGFDYKRYLKSNRNSRRDRNKTSTNN